MSVNLRNFDLAALSASSSGRRKKFDSTLLAAAVGCSWAHEIITKTTADMACNITTRHFDMMNAYYPRFINF
jgi:hypothetical protein